MLTEKINYKIIMLLGFHFKKSLALLAVLSVLCFMCASDAYAQRVSNEGVTASVNTLSFIRGLNSGNKDSLRVAILYDTNISGTEDEARQVKNIIDTIKPGYQTSLVNVNELEAAKSSDVFYVVTNLSPHYAAIKSFYLANHIFSIGSDEQCIRQDCCLISIRQSGGSIDVLMNSNSLSRAGFDIDAVLRYMAVNL
jgi:hypothetical protein